MTDTKITLKDLATKADLDSSIKQLRNELRNDIADVRIELHEEINNLDFKFQKKLDVLRSDMKQEFHKITSMLDSMATSFKRLSESIPVLSYRTDRLENHATSVGKKVGIPFKA